MSVMFNTDLDKKLDKLSLGERTGTGPEMERKTPATLAQEWRPQPTDRRLSGMSGMPGMPGITSGISPVLPGDRRAPSGITSSLTAGLSSPSGPSGTSGVISPGISQKSLLSTSLANERNLPNRMAYFSLDEAADSPGYIDIPGSYTDDHPEPQLLASSVGKDMDGRIIPSSSTISLLSLNHHDDHKQKMAPSKSYNSSRQYPPAYLDRKNSYTNIPTGTGAYTIPSKNSYTNIPSKNSFTNIPRKNSITHLNQQRLQTYHRLTSPPPGSVTSPVNPMSPAHSDSIHSTSQSIPIQNAIIVPDSPNLDPTSLGGSPSRFWLTSQTPPCSLNNSYNRSRTFLQGMQFTQIQSQTPQTIPQQEPHGLHHTEGVRPIHISLDNHNYTTANTNFGISSSINEGSNSPIINPVQTPSEDPPMTPLFLNRVSGAIETSDSYFGNFSAKLDEGEEEEDEEEDEESQSARASLSTANTDANGDYDMN